MLPEEEKDSYGKLLVSLQKRFRSLDIEELRGLEFHQLMQEGRSVEELGVELQNVGRKLSLPATRRNLTASGQFYQALHCKKQFAVLTKFVIATQCYYNNCIVDFTIDCTINTYLCYKHTHECFNNIIMFGCMNFYLSE